MKNAPEQRININPVGETLIIRTGEAEVIKYKKSIDIKGTLQAPFQFLQGRGELDEKQMHLRIDHNNNSLQLIIGDTDPNTTHTVSGVLFYDMNLQLFQINTDKRWAVRDFIKFLRERKFFFSNAAEHEKLVSGLMQWSANVDILIKEHNDNRGNSLFQLETKVKKADGFQDHFTLNIPIFQGYDKEKFKVEIGLDPKTTGVDLFLISDELYQLTFSAKEKIISDEVAKFDKYSFSKVVVS